ncbi:MAG: MATE family efflux transporter, partial [Oceanospirillum sp.]|nr:MATE family efflux transporter [Oceanospirillum sp.]
MQTTTKKTFAIPPLFTEIKYLLAIALPIMGAQLAQSGMGVIDTLMVGRLGADHLAAVALGTSIWMPLFLFLSGVLLGLTPFIAQWLGADTPSEVGPFAFQGFWLGLIISVLSIVIMLFHADILRLMVVPEHLLPLVSDYMLGIMIGFPALGFYQTMRSYTEGLGFTRPVLIISVGMLLFNLVANWVLIYGMGPIPALGVMGCGFATAIAMWGGVLMLWLYIRLNHRYNETRLLDHPSLPRWGEIRKMSAVGVPIGVAIFFEVGLFTTIALFIARLGSTQVAAHQIALNVTSVTFMVPLSLAMALTVRVGNSIGAGGYGYGKRVSLVGTGCTVFACFFTAGIMYFLPGMIAK